MILAVLIMSAVVAIGITVSTVVVTQVRINEVVSNTHEGYYAAESGLEQGLHAVQLLKTSETLAGALTKVRDLELPVGEGGHPNIIVAENQAFFPTGDTKLVSSTDQTSVGETIPELPENQSVYVEMYDVDDSLNVAGAPVDFNAPTLCVYAESNDGANDEVLEVTWIAWNSRLESSRSQRVLVSFTNFSSSSTCTLPESGGKGAQIPLTQFYPAFEPTLSSTLAGFRIRITPLKPTTGGNGDVKNFNAYLNPKPTSQIRLKSVSSGKNQKQALVATFPWSLPLSSLFDFVIFSERTLEKSIELSVSEDVKTFGPYQFEANINPSEPELNAQGQWDDCNGNGRNWCTTYYGVNQVTFCPGAPRLCQLIGPNHEGKNWQGVHCGADFASTSTYCNGVAGGANKLWLNPGGTTTDTQSIDFKCLQTIVGNVPQSVECGFTEYNTNAAYGQNSHKFGVVVPDAPFADCTIGPCNYYVRIRGKFNRTVKVNYIENGGASPTFFFNYDTQSDASSLSLKAQEQTIQPFNGGAASSCILPTPITVNPGVTTRFLIIRSPANTESNFSGGFGQCSNDPTILCDASAQCGGGFNFCQINRTTTFDSYDILTQPSFLGPEEGYCPIS